VFFEHDQHNSVPDKVHMCISSIEPTYKKSS